MDTPRSQSGGSPGPLQSIDQWDDDVRDRYATPQQDASFRNYAEGTRPGVREFYRQNHQQQTLQFAREIRQKYLPLRRRQMSVWEAIEALNQIVDDSDPDTELPQIEHALQTAEAIRADGHPRWFILAGLIHDLGKVLCLFGEPQWAVVGDTFPVGCRFSDTIILHEFFAENPDTQVDEYQTDCGIYAPGCGLSQVLMSWGHDEYLYHVVGDRLPREAQYIIRYHSFYPWHREGAYRQLMDEQDRQMLPVVQQFNPYDLYTKSSQRPDVQALLPFYHDLVEEFLPGQLQW